MEIEYLNYILFLQYNTIADSGVATHGHTRAYALVTSSAALVNMSGSSNRIGGRGSGGLGGCSPPTNFFS